jgi:GH15 family glucan-1,4-alpha-glucosidase
MVKTAPDLPGIISGGEIALTARHLVSLQQPSGQIPWFPGGHCDPWNHVEAAMALVVTGHVDEAQAAYRWLAARQLGDGSWFNYYVNESVKDARIDTNVCAYIAAGLWHYVSVTGDRHFARELFPTVARALNFVSRWQLDDGTIRWSLDSAGHPERYALLTGSSSIYHSLRCGALLADALGESAGQWASVADRLGHALAHHPGAFAPKNQFAMDWYYPVLAGVLPVSAARQRLADGFERHVLDFRGVRCVSTNDWVTAAETAECALALVAVGWEDRARDVLSATRRHRREDGAYWTGIAYPDEVTFPAFETSSYTAAAIILAWDALTAHSAGHDLFSHRFDQLKFPAIGEGCSLDR